MGLNKNNQLKFDEGKTTEPLQILSAGMEELEFGSKYVVHIKQTIEGYDHFLPSPGLEKKIKEENIDVGDKITIEKVAKSDKYPYGFFTVKVAGKGSVESMPPQKVLPQKDDRQKSPEERFESKFPVNKLDVHELAIRIERLETITATLWEDYGNRTSEAGHKPGDDDIPF